MSIPLLSFKAGDVAGNYLTASGCGLAVDADAILALLCLVKDETGRILDVLYTDTDGCCVGVRTCTCVPCIACGDCHRTVPTSLYWKVTFVTGGCTLTGATEGTLTYTDLSQDDCSPTVGNTSGWVDQTQLGPKLDWLTVDYYLALVTNPNTGCPELWATNPAGSWCTYTAADVGSWNTPDPSPCDPLTWNVLVEPFGGGGCQMVITISENPIP